MTRKDYELIAAATRDALHSRASRVAAAISS